MSRSPCVRLAACAVMVAGVAGCAPMPGPESRTTPITTNVPGAVRTASGVDSAVFVTRLGNDTLVVEQMIRSGSHVEAEVLMRTPSTTRTRWMMDLSPAGQMTRLQRFDLDVATGAVQGGARQVVTRASDDSIRIESMTQAGTRVATAAAPATALPFIDMVHWPYEVVLLRARAMSVDTVRQVLLTGTRTSVFAIGRVGGDSMTITHPSRGTMRVHVDARGRLMGLDAGATTRKLDVERRPWMSIDAIARRWAAADAAGRTAGALSGRDTASAIIASAELLVDYGTPWQRGRTIWGALVPYGEVWRTGANMATHFTTSRDLLLGSGRDTLFVPAGRYTLFSVPQSGGGTFIVSRQTGQTGTAYDPARDLGRIPMRARPLETPAERFTIALADDDGSGAIRLQWAASEMIVPFVVR